MKILETQASRFAPPARVARINLLCEILTSPAEVTFRPSAGILSIRRLWQDNRRQEAISALNKVVQQSEANPAITIPALSLMAHMYIDEGDSICAESVMQRAIKMFSGQTFFRSDDGIGICDAYSLSDRDWLVLAIQALLKGDLETCRQMGMQLESSILRGDSASDSPDRLQIIGDLNAVLGCFAARFGEMDQSEKYLSSAYQCHLAAESHQSACRDLILTSRLAAVQGESQRAARLLDAAECQLIMWVRPKIADCCPLARAVYRTRHLQPIAAGWRV